MAGESVLNQRIEQLLADFHPSPDRPLEPRVQQAVQLARLLQERASRLQTAAERRQQAELDRMIKNPRDKATMIQMTDQAFRSSAPERVADQLTHILDVQGVPRFFSRSDRALLRGFRSLGSWIPTLTVPLVKEKMQHETADVILPAEPESLAGHLHARCEEGLRMNVNLIGEAMLSEQEAARRLEAYLELLQRPEVEVVSVKISTLYSQISPLARQHSVSVLADRLELLYRAAAKFRFRRADGTQVPKLVYLDMEEYRDMDLTARAFMQALDRPDLQHCQGGIALQAYIPDSYRVQVQLNQWARNRVARGGEPVTLRIVKGANLEMERVEASIRGWPQAPYPVKLHTDANYKRMLREALRPENLAAVRVGVASHNLFEVAYALILTADSGASDRVQFEMLQGMASPQRRALFEISRDLLLYAPACEKKDFLHAIGYLIRRLDENTGPDNFLAHAFKIRVGSEDWQRLERQFIDSCAAISSVSDAPRRTQDRNAPPAPADDVPVSWKRYRNEPDTDFSLPHNGGWAERILADWKDRCGQRATQIPLCIAGREVTELRDERSCLDPSRPGVIVGRYRQANEDDIQRAVACAKADEDHWRAFGWQQRTQILRRVAHEIRCARAELMGAALAEAGKTLLESDPEVSEAVDFVEFYAQTAAWFQQLEAVQAQGRGVVAVVSPWNFPIAIPCGGVAAALAAGNTVILKPASAAVLVAHQLCACFWRAGVSQRTLQLVPCEGATAGQQLVSHADVDAVVLTGGTDTALAMLRHKPTMNLLAETGGKNATIVTAMADRDLAVKNVLHSAFSHAGQKCSATSLLILEQEVYEDEDFRRVLCEAVQSLPVGSSWELHHRVSPLIRPPGGVLKQGLKELEEGESWAVMPRFDPDNPHLVTPGVKWGVRPGSFTHLTELFGPLLGVMKAKDLEEAIELVNATGYGLTSGLESLDDREQTLWQQRVRAGNLYINRPTTGAIVLRQPFGGMGKSSVGPGIKAGGPNYVAQLMRFSAAGSPPGDPLLNDPHLAALRGHLQQLAAEPQGEDPEEVNRTIAAIESYHLYYRQEFARDHDHVRLLGQDNLRRYLPIQRLRIRIAAEDGLFEIAGRIAAAQTAGGRVTVSTPLGFSSPLLERMTQWTSDWGDGIEYVRETDEQLADEIKSQRLERVRYAAADRVPLAVREAAAASGVYIADSPVAASGRIELLWYVREQSLCIDYHRYGNLGARADEPRSPVL